MNVKIVYYPQVITADNKIREIIIEAQFKEKVEDVLKRLRIQERISATEEFYLKKIDRYGDLIGDSVNPETSAKDFIEASIAVYAYEKISEEE